MLFDSGVSRASARIIEEQTVNLTRHEGETLEALHSIKRDAYRMKETLLRGDITGFAACMRVSWAAKKRLAGSVTNDALDQTVEAGLEAGAQAGKASGAGGGGFNTFLLPPERRIELIRALSRQEGRVMTCHFIRHRTEGWKVA